MKHNNVLTFSMVEPSHITDGLYVPTNGLPRILGKDGFRRRPPFALPARKFGDAWIKFEGQEQLGADDQGVFLAIAAVAGFCGETISHNNSSTVNQQLRFDLGLRDSQAIAARIKTSKRQLAEVIGYAQPEKRHSEIWLAVNRLRKTYILELSADGVSRQPGTLISADMNEQTGELLIGINPRQARVILKGQHVKISLLERQRLESEAAKILHAWLCANINLGESIGGGNGVAIDKLLPHVYGPDPIGVGISSPVKSKRRGAIKDALIEISTATHLLSGGYGWIIEADRTHALITRPKDLPPIERAQIVMDASAGTSL